MIILRILCFNFTYIKCGHFSFYFIRHITPKSLKTIVVNVDFNQNMNYSYLLHTYDVIRVLKLCIEERHEAAFSYFNGENLNVRDGLLFFYGRGEGTFYVKKLFASCSWPKKLSASRL